MKTNLNNLLNKFVYMPKQPQKTQEELVGLSRMRFINQLHSIGDSIVRKPPSYNMHGLVDENKIKWFFKNLFHLGNWRYPYQHYAKPSINDGIFRMEEKTGDKISIALLSDWASDTKESQAIAELAKGHDYSIHLGDTYYVGNSSEIAENFNNTFGGTWPYGKLGSFAMLGNHEMYSGGRSYFTELLPYMGVYSGRDTRQQEASFFCLENDYWRVVGLDTGYNSLRGRLGLTANTDMKLHETQMQWLTETVQLEKDNRGIIFLSHHQPISAFEKEEFGQVITQLAPLLGNNRPVLWFWGHEHRLAIYGHNDGGGTMQYYGRCIGNSGMPVEIKHMPKLNIGGAPIDRNLVLYDKREREIMSADITLGHNGYVVLTLDEADARVDYFDESFRNKAGHPSPILTEKWMIDKNSGKLKGLSISDHTVGMPPDQCLTHFRDKLTWALAVDR